MARPTDRLGAWLAHAVTVVAFVTAAWVVYTLLSLLVP